MLRAARLQLHQNGVMEALGHLSYEYWLAGKRYDTVLPVGQDENAARSVWPDPIQVAANFE
jgi:hypothetical protein